MTKKRKQGKGTLRKRKDNRWEGRVVIGYNENGLPITKNVTSKSKTECRNKLNKLIEQFDSKSNTISSDITFGEWIDFWYKTYIQPNIRDNTKQSYENAIYNHIIPDMGKIKVKDMTEQKLQHFYADVKSKGRKIRVESQGSELSDRSVRSIHTCCYSALERAVTDNLIKINPSAKCKLPPKKSKEMQILSKNEIVRFLFQAKEEGYYELFLLELGTGMRRGEILALKWDDLNFTTGELNIERQVYILNGKPQITVPKTKTSIRTIILPQSLLNILKSYKQTVDSEWIFPSPLDKNKTRNPSAVRKRLKLILERSGCKNIRFHDLRHTFATMALENGMDIKTLSATIGHISSATTLDIYSHITDTMQQQAAINIDKQICKNNAPYEQIKPKTDNNTTKLELTPYKPKIRKPGTGCITQINDHLFEGRYSPKGADGKRIRKNIYAKTREECEIKLAKLIEQTKAEIQAEKLNIDKNIKEQSA